MSGRTGIVGASVLLASMIAASADAQTASRPLPGGGVPDLTVKGPPVAPGEGQVVTPDSSVAKPGDVGQRARTHYKIFVPTVSGYAKPNAGAARPAVAGGPPYPGYYNNTPASLACVYGFAAPTAGCNPETLTSSGNATGGSRAIALVDAYDDPSAMTDLQNYSTQFGLPAITSSNFQVVYASGSQPSGNTGWGLEEALDIEMAHAMAPSAKIFLVEATSNSYTDLNAAVAVATNLVQQYGGGEVSMSYGGTEFSNETSYDSQFIKSNVVFFASTGDTPGTEWPSVSPKVVAVGGTSTSRQADNRVAGQYGFYLRETAWINTGGGISQYETAPPAQAVIASKVGSNMRAVPDIAADASDATRVWVNCSSGCGYGNNSWLQVYGTSVASPLVAAMTNNAGSFLAGTGAEQRKIYAQIGTSNIYDVTIGACGTFAGYGATTYSSSNAATQWDFCTGVGTPRGPGGL